MQKKKTFKRPLLMVLIALGLSLIAYFITLYFIDNKSEKKSVSGEGVVLLTQKNNNNLDSDNDGVPDWREELIPELDPNNPDSDGDGVGDAQYLRQQQRDLEASLNKSIGVSETITESQRLGRGVYTALNVISEAGDISDADREVVVDNVADYIAGLDLDGKTFISADFLITPNNKEDSLVYKKSLDALSKKYPIRLSEFELLLKAPSDPDRYGVDIQLAKRKYNAYLGELLTLPVPLAVKKDHIELVNIISDIAGVLNNLAKDKEDQDDVVIFSSLIQINTLYDKTIKTLSNIGIYFDLIDQPNAFSDEQ